MKYIGAHVSAAGGLANALPARLKLAQRPLRFHKTSASGVPPPYPRVIDDFKIACEKYHFRRRKSFPTIVT